MTKNLIVLIGPSGAGKSSAVKLLCEQHNFQQIKSYTTRKQRSPEDIDHTFVSQDEFNSMNAHSKFLGILNIFGYSYGLPKFNLGLPTVILLRAPAVNEFTNTFPGARIIEIDASLPTIMTRLIKRGSPERFEPAELEKEIALGRSLAHKIIDTTDLSVEETVNKILE